MKNKLQRLVKPLLAVAFLGVIVLVLGFVERRSDRMPATELRVEVSAPEGVRFISADDIRRRVLERNNGLIGLPIGAIDAPAIEADLREIPSVAAADAWHTLDGVLHVRVDQRRPIVRVINRDGSSFYIDVSGTTLPVSDAYTARVLVVTGALEEPYAQGVHDVTTADAGEGSRSAAIHRLAQFILADPLWSALIDQVVVNSAGEFELIPRIGMQRILIGDGTALDQRFGRLREFYAQGIEQSGWRKYARVDVRFADQIVCTNRTK